LVVGERWHGYLAGLVLGSATQLEATYPKCPMAVVH
jgi:nucleotide-binding universal stress UspA family protein